MIQKELKDLSKFITITEKNFFVKVPCQYVVSREFENAITIDEVKKVIKHICNFSLVIKPEDEQEIETLVNTNTMLSSKFDRMETTSEFYIFYLDNPSELFDGNVFVKTVGNASSLFFLLMGGKVGNDEKVSYGEVYDLIYNGMNDNEIRNKPSISYEILISEMMRDIKDTTKPFRYTVNEVNLKTGFKPINIREIPKMQSPTSALISEDIFDGMVSIINNAKDNKENDLTPVEQIMLNKY